MNRRTAILVGSLIAVLAGIELIALSGLLAAERSDDRARYEKAITQQRRAAGRAVLPTPGVEPAAPVRTTLCVRQVETFATTLRSLHRDLLMAENRLDVSSLKQLSNQAVQAERYVEQANAGPALPQRMGRERIPSTDGEPKWRSFQPPRVECEDGDAFARFALDIMPASPTAARKP